MPGTNLTRDEAIGRAAALRTTAYEIDLDLTTGPQTFRTVTRVTFTATPGADT